MAKYWRKTVMPDYSRTFKNWQTDISLVPKEGTFLGRITGTNRAVAVFFNHETQTIHQATGGEVDICQWLTYAEYGNLRACVWRNA